MKEPITECAWFICENFGFKHTVFHFWFWAWAYTAANVVVDAAHLRLIEDATNYFRYNFTPADLGPNQDAGQEFSLPIGRDNEASFTRTGYPHWGGINKVRFYAATIAEDEVYIEVDGIGKHNMNYGGYQSDGTSRSAYRTRVEIQQDNALTAFSKSLDVSTSVLEKKKDPLEQINLKILGSSAIVSSNLKLLPGNTVVLNLPLLGISSETWRLTNLAFKCFPYFNLSHGHDFIGEISCLPQNLKVDSLKLAQIVRRRSPVPRISEEAFKRRAESRIMLP